MASMPSIGSYDRLKLNPRAYTCVCSRLRIRARVGAKRGAVADPCVYSALIARPHHKMDGKNKSQTREDKAKHIIEDVSSLLSLGDCQGIMLICHSTFSPNSAIVGFSKSGQKW